jgi:hypothetical protein
MEPAGIEPAASCLQTVCEGREVTGTGDDAQRRVREEATVGAPSGGDDDVVLVAIDELHRRGDAGAVNAPGAGHQLDLAREPCVVMEPRAMEPLTPACKAGSDAGARADLPMDSDA